MKKIYQKWFLYRKNFGLTLIELLVVVLIIGILAAVAVPQYKKAVLKTDAMIGFRSLKDLEKAEQSYFIANGQYTTDLEALDLKPGVSIRCTATLCQFDSPRKKFMWEMTFNTSKTIYFLFCAVGKDDEAAMQVCKSLGGTSPYINGSKKYYRFLYQ